ncbi:MAG: hypothetical protein LBH84_00460 [Prevotellaceae bacterium]|jgi:hypothetical protein|nr:hypothetical protein [Prevotellaceae bacterium]
MDKRNIGKGSDAFKIGDDGTIIRINQPSNQSNIQQPAPQKPKGSNGWIGVLALILIIAGGAIFLAVWIAIIIDKL